MNTKFKTKPVAIIAAIIICLTLIISQRAGAAGLGLNVNRSNSNAGRSENSGNFDPIMMIFRYIPGSEIIFDTALEKDRLFNYRLNLSFNSSTARKDLGTRIFRYDLNRTILSNTFGFSLMNNGFLKVWAGPQLTVSYEYKNLESIVSGHALYSTVGPVLGFNFNADELITFGLELGFRGGGGFNLSRSGDIISGDRLESFACVNLIFRTLDFFTVNTL